VLYRQRIAPEAMREAKREEFAALKAKLGGAGSKDLAPNNAFLAAFATYTDLVSSFEYLLQEEGGDLERFYVRVKKYAASAPSDRGPFSAPAK